MPRFLVTLTGAALRIWRYGEPERVRLRDGTDAELRTVEPVPIPPHHAGSGSV